MSRLAIVDVTRNPKHLSRNGLLVLVNPVITCQTGEQVGREGCMSIPEFTANIKRASSVTVAYSTLDGERLVIEADGFEAVVLQHEIDHLNGIVFLDRLTSEADLFRRASRGMGK
jgi:peptide deformylase